MSKRVLAREAWAKVDNGAKLLERAENAKVPKKALVLGACACARLALPYVPKGEKRPLRAIETAEAWARGEATSLEVKAAGLAAGLAASDASNAWSVDTRGTASDDASVYAGFAATNAAGFAASDDAWDAASVATKSMKAVASDSANYAIGETSDDAWGAAWNDAWDDAWSAAQRKCADVVHEAIPWPVVARAMEKHGQDLGETWLETIMHDCGYGDVDVAVLSQEDEGMALLSRIDGISREMADKGQWNCNVIAPLQERARELSREMSPPDEGGWLFK